MFKFSLNRSNLENVHRYHQYDSLSHSLYSSFYDNKNKYENMINFKMFTFFSDTISAEVSVPSYYQFGVC